MAIAVTVEFFEPLLEVFSGLAGLVFFQGEAVVFVGVPAVEGGGVVGFVFRLGFVGGFCFLFG